MFLDRCRIHNVVPSFGADELVSVGEFVAGFIRASFDGGPDTVIGSGDWRCDAIEYFFLRLRLEIINYSPIRTSPSGWAEETFLSNVDITVLVGHEIPR